MIRRAPLLLLLPLLLCCILPGLAEAPDPLLRAMTDEMGRTVEQLRLEQLDRPYFVAQTVYDQRVLSLEGSFGAIARPRERQSRMLRLELRVGSREFDDNHFIPTDTRTYLPLTAPLSVDDDYDALRFVIWSLTDRAYKQALDRLSRKRAYRDARKISEIIPDLSEEPVQSSESRADVPEFDVAAWEQQLREASAVFRDYPRIQSSHVRLSLNAQHVYFVDSEGRRFVRPSHLFEISIGGKGQADDGMLQQDEVKIVRSTLEALPAGEDLQQAVRRFATELSALTEAPTVQIYLGPVLLEGQAAGEFFNQLLAAGLCVARKPWAEQEWAAQYFQRGRLLDRIGLRVISPLFDVYDDPTVAEAEGIPLAGHYTMDDQGIPARRVDLIRRGILDDMLMSRSPTEERANSNGHGRGGMQDPISAQVANLFLQPAETVSLAELKQRLRQEARAFGLEYGLLIRRIADDTRRDRNSLLAPPVLVYQVDVATGKETLVRDARFQSVTLRALRDVVAASAETHVYNVQRRGSAYSRGAIPTGIVHPSVLLEEMELAEVETEPQRPPYLPHPYFAPAEPAAAAAAAAATEMSAPVGL